MTSSRLTYSKSELESLKGTDNVDKLSSKFKSTSKYNDMITATTKSNFTSFHKSNVNNNDLNPMSISLGPQMRTWQNGCQVGHKDSNRNSSYKSGNRKHYSDNASSFRTNSKKYSESSTDAASSQQPEWFVDGPDTIYDTFDMEAFQNDVEEENPDTKKISVNESSKTAVTPKKEESLTLDWLITKSLPKTEKVDPPFIQNKKPILTLADIENGSDDLPQTTGHNNVNSNPSVCGILNSLMNISCQTNPLGNKTLNLQSVEAQMKLLSIKGNNNTSIQNNNQNPPVMLSQIENLEMNSINVEQESKNRLNNPQFPMSINGRDYQSPILKKTISQNQFPINPLSSDNPNNINNIMGSLSSPLLNNRLEHLNQIQTSSILAQHGFKNHPTSPSNDASDFLDSIISTKKNDPVNQINSPSSSIEAFLQNRLQDLSLNQQRPPFMPNENGNFMYPCNKEFMKPVRRSIVKRSNYDKNPENYI